jgi:hypothetical protein
MLLLSLSCFAPNTNYINILVGSQIKPIEALVYATSIVESNNNRFALNEKEQSFGALQIRAIRLEDYRRRTGIRYQLTDMFDYEKAKEVFLYYASKYGPYQIEKISKKWNGSGPMTDVYWNKIKVLL